MTLTNLASASRLPRSRPPARLFWLSAIRVLVVVGIGAGLFSIPLGPVAALVVSPGGAVLAQGPAPASGNAGSEALDAEARRIAGDLQCPICSGQSVADSQTELAGEMRNVIKTKLRAGESRQQIVDFFVARYGETVLRVPPKSGFALGAWLVPFAALAGGLALVGFALRRWTRRSPLTSASPATSTTTSAVDEPLDEYERRVMQELAAEEAR
ncbi:MAG: cytochrome c-type biogenesis protein CcmH [Chloroflexi bacterium]|nr:cytochrome c-type biogenesis protein CcmH [Chloroflexota bacterium]